MLTFIEQAKAVGFDLVIVVAGLGLFLFGINAIGEELKVIAGTRLKTIIDRYTTNKVKGLIVGIVVTALLQSSSATTALVISLIRSGLMSFTQALAVMMGSNIGTTITAIMIGFNLGVIAPYAILIGAGIILFSKSKKVISYSHLAIYFGILFFGLELMGDGLKVLSEMPMFADFAVILGGNAFYGVLLGIGMTMLIQSSSATIGILQTLYASGALTLSASLPILLGNNIGTTITAVLAAIGGSKDAKKTAFFHTFVNVIGAVIFISLLPIYTSLVSNVSVYLGLNSMMEIAFAHFMFNLVTMLLLFPFLSQLEAMINKIYKDDGIKEELGAFTVKTTFEHSIIEESPTLALEVAHRGLLEMSGYSKDIFEHIRNFILSKDEENVKSANEIEDMVNELNRSISMYLVEISGANLSEPSGMYLNYLMYSVKDVERIADHLLNVATHVKSIYDQEEEFSPQAILELTEIMKLIDIILSDLNALVDEPSRYLIDRIYGNEQELNHIESTSRNAFITRLKNKVPMGSTSMALYVDILSDFERVGDYASNIANRIKDYIL